MKHFAKKNEQKMKAESPPENFNIIYTEISQKEKSVKKVVICIIFSAKSRENSEHKRHFTILPPSRVSIGRRLNILSANDIIEKFKIVCGWISACEVKRNAKKPNVGPDSEIINSFR